MSASTAVRIEGVVKTFGGVVANRDAPFVCFAAPTAIATPDGPRLAGDLRVGDRVLTLDDGPQRVAWENWQDVQNTILDTLERGQFSQMPLARRKQMVKGVVDQIISEMPAVQDPTGFNPAFQQIQ